VTNISPRIAVDRSEQVLQVVVRFPHSVAWIVSRIIVLSILSVGAYGGVITVSQGYGEAHGIGRLVLLLFASALFVFVSAIVLDTLLRLFGRETILLKDETVVITTELFGACHSRAFPVAESLKFRLLEQRYARRGRTRLLRKIAFDYRNRTIATRGNVSRQEGEGLYRLLAPYFPDPEPLGTSLGSERADQIPE
jgi:hypothetical protein